MPRVLVVDDHEKLCRVLEIVLGGEGFEVRAAHDWKEALSCLDAERFDAVVLDIMLPGMDGYEILRSLRRNPDFERLPVVVCSALGSEEDRRARWSWGPRRCFRSPSLRWSSPGC